MTTVETVMGIPMSIDVRDDLPQAQVAEAVAAAFASLHAADRRFSRHRPDSELSALDRRELAPGDGSADVREVLAIGERMREATGGAFDVRLPGGGFDTDGVVKGWAAERAARVLRAHGLRTFCLNAGGDVVVGAAPDGSPGWNVGVRSPRHPDRMLAVLTVAEAAVATSGAYERGEHIRDGRTGAPAHELASATVFAGDLTTADVLATAVFALGEAGVAWATGHGARGVLALTADGRLLAAGDLPLAR
ncbi:FAD:protein FMN transferase [Leifsonia sp. F6_8S_P_1B]|uniref:FAD:protein FMN transferase n=1 Tax=Leifsonia williamsii TaxID=3035919 RepID=A0ABT8K9U3_9MICO|nr:FAD:protein FMN transferase [Leifsonia williamsii]MDN4614179.1 FAD:protein FMN transferase [Leifsonia williamsii]